MTAAETKHLQELDDATTVAEKSLEGIEPQITMAALLRAAARVAVRTRTRPGLLEGALRAHIEHALHEARSRRFGAAPRLRAVE